MTNEVTENKAAARALAARLPGWVVWYGQHTQRFWAAPRSPVPAGTRMAEADTVEKLEEAVRCATGEGAAWPEGSGVPGPRPEAPAQEGHRATPTGPGAQHHRQPVTANG